jgi:hypothetical protein
MRRRITWRSAAAISMLGLAPAMGAAFAAPAGASTKACAGALGGQCGTFTASKYDAHPKGGASGGLGWDVKGQSTASNTPLIQYPNYTPGTDPATDLTKVEHHGTLPGSLSARAVTWFSIVYTPSGQWTSMCLSNPMGGGGVPGASTALVLRDCNGSVWQSFLAVNVDNHGGDLPSAPTNSDALVGTNASTTHAAFGLYSIANDMYVVGNGTQGGALSATGGPGIRAHVGRNSWWWTNARGTGTRR